MPRVLLRSNEDDTGSQIMEFALVLPLLVVFVVAIYDFGQAFNVKEKLNFTVKDAARFGAAQPTNDLTQTIPISVVDRGFVFNSGTQGSPEQLKIIGTHVDISYPYQWHFNSVIKLIAPNSTAAGTTQIDTDAIAANQD